MMGEFRRRRLNFLMMSSISLSGEVEDIVGGEKVEASRSGSEQVEINQMGLERS